MYIKNKKKGFTLIELIIYLAVSLTIILILSDIFIVSYKSFNKNINKDSNINSIENGIVAIKDIVMDSRVIFKENKKNSLLIYQKFKDFYWVQSIYKKDNNLIVEYNEQYFNNVFAVSKSFPSTALNIETIDGENINIIVPKNTHEIREIIKDV